MAIGALLAAGSSVLQGAGGMGGLTGGGKGGEQSSASTTTTQTLTTGTMGGGLDQGTMMIVGLVALGVLFLWPRKGR